LAKTLCYPSNKAALFADRDQLRLPSLKYADNFTCRITKIFMKPIRPIGESPLLLWLWDPLLEFLQPSATTKGFTLEFTPARITDATLPYTVSIKLGTRDCQSEIEMTAAYGGIFDEQRTFRARIASFSFPETSFVRTTAALAIDMLQYRYNGSYNDMLDYLLPRPGSIWRSAMKVTKEVSLVRDLAEICKAGDDSVFVSEDQDSQCKNLLLRLPQRARSFVADENLIGNGGGSFSRRANGPPGNKD
jgi:hypothetical protein